MRSMHGQSTRWGSIAAGLAIAGAAWLGAAGRDASLRAAPPMLQFVFTSDAHYGITRQAFRGLSDVDAHTVNAALVAAINRVPDTPFPDDGGLRSGQPVGPVDFVVEGGDVANREEVEGATAIQPAAKSWAQFRADYIDGLRLTDAAGRQSPLFIVPGNHDVTDAIGFYKPMVPPSDPTSMVRIYDRMMAPPAPLTNATYVYWKDRILTSREFDGVHFVFLTVWPDSQTRAWLDDDLRQVSASEPVIIFTHDEPNAESKHFRNPNGNHGIDAADKFENLLSDTFADGTTTKVPPTIEERALERFFDRHPNISAYFHGNSNWNQFYDWTGPDHTAAVHTFRVDSPMKGEISRHDETQLSFQVATFDPVSRTLTVRECLWNTRPGDPAAPLVWGGSTTVALEPRPPAPRP
jgi:hypothetical protein